MTRSTLLLTILALIIFIGGTYTYLHFTHVIPPNSSSSSSNTNDSAIRAVVTEFGTNLKDVSLLAPDTDRKAAMKAAYSSYVASELLAEWYKPNSDALGRSTSSPWPEKIDVVSVTPHGDTYTVEGNVIEVTSTEQQEGKAAAVYPVTLELQNREGHWLIIKVSKGAYSELPQQRTIIGYWECLPHANHSGPQTTECAFGIAEDQSDGHYAIDTRLMSTYPVDFPTGTKVQVTGVVTPANQLNSIQKYDIDGIISATSIQKI